MPDEKTPPGPFRIVSEPPALAPRVGPTMIEIKDRLEKMQDLCERGLKRMQQTALMVDSFGSTLNRRFDVLHEEAALLRASLQRPQNDIEVDVVGEDKTEDKPERSSKQKAQRAAVFTGKALSYATTLAIVLRLVAKGWPQYQEAVDALLGLVGL